MEERKIGKRERSDEYFNIKDAYEMYKIILLNRVEGDKYDALYWKRIIEWGKGSILNKFTYTECGEYFNNMLLRGDKTVKEFCSLFKEYEKQKVVDKGLAEVILDSLRDTFFRGKEGRLINPIRPIKPSISISPNEDIKNPIYGQTVLGELALKRFGYIDLDTLPHNTLGQLSILNKPSIKKQTSTRKLPNIPKNLVAPQTFFEKIYSQILEGQLEEKYLEINLRKKIAEEKGKQQYLHDLGDRLRALKKEYKISDEKISDLFVSVGNLENLELVLSGRGNNVLHWEDDEDKIIKKNDTQSKQYIDLLATKGVKQLGLRRKFLGV